MIDSMARVWRSLRLAQLPVLALSVALGCGGGSGPGPVDGATGDATTDGETDAGDGGGLCAADGDCDDGLFCNGAERCAPSDARADVRGCVLGPDPCLADQTCDEAADACQTLCDVSGDADGDGHDSIDCDGDDCDDADATRYPGNVELCDGAGHDEDCDPTTYGADADLDGHQSSACCNGADNCGSDCDDSNVNVNPDASDVCNGGIDDDCDGLADLADGVCVPCPAGHTGFDGNCTDIDECLTATTCGDGRASCTNTDGSYACGCQTGYAAPATGGTCMDVDECATTAPCGVLATGCVNTVGSYACSCMVGYGAPTTGGTCSDLDECALGTCTVNATDCVNTIGSYTCTCAAGYSAPAMGGPCADVDECAVAATCGAERASCANGAGSYACTCYTGYSAPATGGTCEDVNECELGTDDCDSDPSATCDNTPGAFTCTCPTSFAGGAAAGHGTAGCLLSDPSLSSLVPSAGALSPTFDAGTTTYSLGLPLGTTSVTLTPAVADPTRATITVDGVTLASGVTSAPITLPLGFAARPVAVTITTESGATRTYTVVVGRGSAYVKASNTSANDFFGYPVALSADGSTLVVGASQEDSNATGVGGDQTNNAAVDAGAVYVFTRSGSTWLQEAYLKASNTGAGDNFGTSVALSSDGSTLAVGASQEDSTATGIDGDQTSNAGLGSGAVYVFTRAAGVWSQQAYVKASNTGNDDSFGAAVALSADGSTLAVGASQEDSTATGIDGDQTSNAGLGSGAVYVFTRAAGVWSQQAYVKASNTGNNDSFGTAVALSADGATLAVGASQENSNATGIDGDQSNDTLSRAGAVYVFTRAAGVWSQQAYVKASNTGDDDFFGTAVALSADGATLAVGAIWERSSAVGIGGDQTDNAAARAGAVYVFTRAGTRWSQEAYVKASNTDAYDVFGYSFALSADGSMLAVGAYGEGSNATGVGGDQTANTLARAGAVYVFTRAASVWSQRDYVKASNTGRYDQFGTSVALSSDGSTLAVGASQEDSNATGVGGDQSNNSASSSGAVYVF